MTETVLEYIFLHLKRKGVRVYFPGSHVGECLEEYVVVKPAQQSFFGAYSTEYAVYDLMLYVPLKRFSGLEVFASRIKAYMKEMKKTHMIREQSYQNSPYYEDSVKAYMVSIQYRVYRRKTV